MTKKIILIMMLIVLTSCARNAQLKAVLKDFDSTPRCDSDPVLTHPKDTKNSLNAKLLILNYKVACMRDWYYYFEEKLKSYKKL